MLNSTESMQNKMNERETLGRISIPVKLLALYFILMPLDSIDLFGMGSLLKVIAFFPVFAILFLHRKHKILLNKPIKWLIAYTMIMAISCFYSISFSDSMSHVNRLVINVVLMVFIGGIYDDYNENEYRVLIYSLVIGGLINIVLSFVFGDTSGSSGRLTMSIAGSRQDQNYLNGYSLLAMAFFFKKLISEKKVLAIVPIFINIIFTLMTGSRGSIIAIAVVACATIICTFFMEKNQKPATVIITILIIALVSNYFDRILMLISPNVAQRFTIEFFRNYRGLNRTDLWKALLIVFRDSTIFRQLFGYGIGTVPYVNSLTHQVAHNLWLEHLLANGILGLIALLGMQISFLKEAFRSKNMILISTYIGFLTMCVTLSLTSYKPLWNVMMMIMIKSQIDKQKEL